MPVDLDHHIPATGLVGVAFVDSRPHEFDLIGNARQNPDGSPGRSGVTLGHDANRRLELSIAFHDELDRLNRRCQHDSPGDLAPLANGRAVDALDLIPGKQAGAIGGTVRHDGSNPGRGGFHPKHVHDHEKEEREQNIHDHARGHDRHSVADRLVDKGGGIILELQFLRFVVEILLPQHFHVTAQRQHIKRITRFSLGEPEKLLAEPHRKSIHAHLRPLGDGKVPQLMHKDDDGKTQQHQKDRPELTQPSQRID